MKSTLSFLLLSLIFLNACKREELRIAAFLRIEGDSLITTAEQGANTRNIPYVTVYQNDNPQGTYEPPGSYPIIAEGNTNLVIRPHIRRLARSGFFVYSLYEPFEFNAFFRPKAEETITPIYRYRSNLKVVWAENFNSPAIRLRARRGEFDTLVTENDPARRLDNTSYGVIRMKPDFSFFELESTEEFTLPQDQRDIYLELDYNCNVPFSIGLFAIDDQQEVAVVSVTPFATNGQWRKGYVYLTEDVMGESRAKRYRLLLRGQVLEPFTPVIYLENMRLLHLE